jgi:hypothetical protein
MSKLEEGGGSEGSLSNLQKTLLGEMKREEVKTRRLVIVIGRRGLNDTVQNLERRLQKPYYGKLPVGINWNVYDEKDAEMPKLTSFIEESEEDAPK